MKVIGITGGIGAGKSTVIQTMVENYNAMAIIADEIAREFMQPGTISYQLIVTFFGTDILDKTGFINRDKLSELVFCEKQKLKKLNTFIHPYVKDYIIDKIQTIREEKGVDYILIESAILIEAGYLSICDEIWQIVTQESVRRERLKQSRGYTDKKIDTILNNQMSDSELEKFCTKRIQNNGENSELIKQIEILIEDLQ